MPDTPTIDRPLHPDADAPPRLLITAGGTREPIDQVRFIGNRSSGRMGAAVAGAARDAGWPVTLLLGTHELASLPSGVTIDRFETTADLASLLGSHIATSDILVMAAAVADFTPSEQHPDKIRRRSTEQLTLDLVPTPDLLAATTKQARPDQLIVGFALEPTESLIATATEKLQRKNVDLIVANPINTLDSERVAATLVDAHGPHQFPPSTKHDFAALLIAQLADRLRIKQTRTDTSTR